MESNAALTNVNPSMRFISPSVLAGHLGCTATTVRRWMKTGVLPAVGVNDQGWAPERLDELVQLATEYRSRVKLSRMEFGRRMGNTPSRPRRMKRRVGRITPLELGAFVGRDVTAIYRWLRRGGVIDVPDSDGTWPIESKGRLIAQVKEYKRVDLERRRAYFKVTAKIVPSSKAPKPSPTTDSMLANANLRMFVEHFEGDRQAALRLLRDFAGLTVRFSSPQSIERLFQQQQIARSLTRDSSSGATRRLADATGLNLRQVTKMFLVETGVSLKEHRAAMAAAVTDDDLNDS